MKTRSIKKDIAIIGMSGKFPKSENIEEFWKNLIEGNELIYFYTDSELEKLGVSPDLINNRKYIKSSLFLEDSGSFDYSFFGYTKEEAELMDPQIRILHEQAWLSLEDSGYNPFNYANKIGCFFNASNNLDWTAHVKLFGNSSKVNPFLIEQISSPHRMSTLISYSLNLKGPSYFIDTACSSSLVAVHVACRSLLMKECSMALAGGVSVSSSANIGYLHEEGMISSKDGRCKAFDIDSSGTVAGEGVGVVVLKRLEDAINDRDNIYSIIRSSSVNNDGNRKIGYTAPSIIGQYECIKSAHQIAEVDPRSISYIETHGTGTKLGDPVEIEALNKAFNYDTSHQCSIGSLKTNIGHLDAAAGVAGLIKTALSLKNKVIPPSLHFKEPNPEINFKSGPFHVNSKLKEWLSENPLLAGVSSLGIGGTNAHVILEESFAQEKGSIPKTNQIILYSAKTKSSIEKYHHKLKDFLGKNKNVDMADLSYTLKTGRNSYRYRKFVICKDNTDAEHQLDKINFDEPFQVKEKRGIVFMFSGQGSQYYKMGKQVYFQFPYFKSIIDEGFAVLKNETGVDYADVIGYNNLKEPENDLINDTCYTQPLLFLLEYAFAKLLLKLGVKPSNMIGHSLGEYIAACISEVFTFEEGLKLIIKRAHLMSKIERGSMLSVDLPSDKIIDLISSDISIAAINTENSCVISGNTKSIDAISDILFSKEISFAKLKTSHAFHSQMMDSILNVYEMELQKIKFSEPKYSFISCTTGVAIKKEEAVSPKYWVNHLRETVNFSKGLDSLLKEGHSTYVEIGSGTTLINFLRQNKNHNSDLFLASVLKHPKEIMDDSYYLLNTLGTIWSTGVDINWNEYYFGEFRNKISAPTYSFDKIIFPCKVNPIQKFVESNAFHLTNGIKEDYSEWIYEQGWKEIKNERSRKIFFDWTICFLNENDFSEKLENELKRENQNVVFVKKGTKYLSLDGNLIVINPSDIEDYEMLSSEIANRFKGSGRIIHAWCVENKSKFESNTETEALSYFSLLNIARTLSKKKSLTSISLDFLVTDLFKVNGNEHISASKSIALAALKVIPKEYENFFCKCIEFLMEDFENSSTHRENLFSKLQTNVCELTLALRGNKTWAPFYEKINVDKELVVESKIKANGLYIVTGANGGMGKTFADFLVNEYNASLILIGRGEENKGVMDNLKKGNNAIYYIKDDLSDLNTLNNKVNSTMATFNAKVDGVFHAAGLGDYSGLIADRTKTDCEKIFLPKIKGTSNLFDTFKKYSPDFFVLCSSISSTLSPFGQVAYVAANLYQNFFAQEHDSKTKIVSIQWDAWKEVGMAVKASKRHGVKNDNDVLSFGISNKDGIDLFKYALNSKSSEIIISINDFNSELSHSSEYTLKRALDASDTSDSTIELEVERPNVKSLYIEAQTETEKMLCELWRSIFGYEKIGVNDDFFELGGDSLKVMTLIKRIHKSFNIEISIGDFFKKSNIKELSIEIDLALEFNQLNGPINELKSNQIRL
jgi:phthiocerol/phenolphthiocerol synthesis type-I polyketide synthase E